MSSRCRALIVIVSTLGLAGCLSSQESPTNPDSSAAGTLVGRTWTLTSLGGHPPVSDTVVTAEFTTDDRVAGRSGCNLYGGSARAGSGRIAVGLLATTLMACERDGVMDQEQRYLATLQAATRYTISGAELRLGTDANASTLVFVSR